MMPRSPIPVAHRRALITGASRGIGAAIAKRLAADGHPIILNYRGNHEAAAKVAEEIRSAGGEVTLSQFDVADRDASAEAIAKLLEDPRPISVLVNNAGIVRDNAFPAMTHEDWQPVIDTTLNGFYNVTHPLVMPMVGR